MKVNGKKAKLRRKGSTIRLRRFRARRFTLQVAVTLDDGIVVKGSRRYRPCE